MKNYALHEERERFNTLMSNLGMNPSISVADRRGIGLIAHAYFDAGDYAPAPWLMLNLCTVTQEE